MMKTANIYIGVLSFICIGLLCSEASAIGESTRFAIKFEEGLFQQVIRGAVTDGESQEPIPGANIAVKGTSTGTVTNIDGEYELSIPLDENVALIFSYIGYETVEIAVTDQTEINVVMMPSVDQLDELVVVGYGTQRRATLTGSIADIGGAQLERTPTVSLTNTFAGRLPGVVALNRSGEPGEDTSSLLIRGRSTLGNNNPLIVIDGVAGRQGLDQIDPADVESISILKDASAAIYGAQAANGVILVTTKRGSISEPTVRYKLDVAANQPTQIPQMADAASYALFYNDILADRNEAPRFSDEEIQLFRDGTDPVNYPDTDWVSETLKDYSTQTQHTLSVQGGDERIRYYLSGNMSNQNSIFKNGITDFQTKGLRANIDLNVNESIQLSLDFSARQNDRMRPSVATSTIINSMWRNYPFLHARYENGLPGAGIERGENPVVMVTDETGYREDKTNLYQTKIGTQIDIPKVQGLAIDGYFSIDQSYGKNTRWRTPWTVYNYNSLTDAYSSATGGPISQPDFRKTSNENRRWTANARVNYQYFYNEHFIESFVAVEHTRLFDEQFYAQREGFISSALDQLFAGSTANQSTSGGSSQINRSNLLGRVSYNFSEKYLLDANFRYDGSSVFPKGKRYGFFPGFSAAWRLSEENFLMNSNWVDDLRLRASWGVLGNDRVPANQHLAAYSFTTGAFFGSDHMTPNIGLQSGVAPNPNITWEEVRTVNFGLDAEFWQGGLGFTIEVFETKRDNILTPRSASIPAYTALRLPDENIGVVQNRGLEVEVSHRQSTQDFSFMSAFNVSFNRNKVIDIDEPAGILEYQQREGKPIGSRLLYLSDGIYMNQDQIDNSPSLPSAMPGDLILRDVNGDGQIDSRDRVRVDQSPTPEVMFGLNINMAYKNWSLAMLWQGATRAKQYFQLQSGLGGNILQEIADHRYREDNPSPKYPNIISSDLLSDYASDFWFMDASYIRFKDLTISYMIPESVSSILNLKNMSLYVSGRNLLTFSHTDWFDPEGLGGTERRRDFYPPNRTFSLGIDISI